MKLGESMIVNGASTGPSTALTPRRSVDDEQVARKQAVPGVLGDDANRQAILRIGTGVALLHEQLAAGQRLDDVVVERVELLPAPSPG